MNPVAQLSLVDRADAGLSIVMQCRLLKVACSSVYWRAPHDGGAAPGWLDG